MWHDAYWARRDRNEDARQDKEPACLESSFLSRLSQNEFIPTCPASSCPKVMWNRYYHPSCLRMQTKQAETNKLRMYRLGCRFGQYCFCNGARIRRVHPRTGMIFSSSAILYSWRSAPRKTRKTLWTFLPKRRTFPALTQSQILKNVFPRSPLQ